jgi:DNA-directed RNA polymerase specialized sigma24 family protein
MAEIYEVARSLLPAARAFSKNLHLDSSTAEDTLMDAAFQVIKSGRKRSEIQNLPAYVFTAYKHLLFAHRNKTEGRQGFNDERWEQLPARVDAFQEIERRILIEQFAKHLDVKTKFIYDRILLDYTYREIAEEYRKEFNSRTNENALRSRFSKALDKLKRQLSGK